MTHQLDMMPGELTDRAVLERIDAQLPKAREVTNPRLPFHLSEACKDELTAIMSPRAVADLQERILEDTRRLDVGHELVLPERAREHHR
jgi:hypothetical protein